MVDGSVMKQMPSGPFMYKFLDNKPIRQQCSWSPSYCQGEKWTWVNKSKCHGTQPKTKNRPKLIFKMLHQESEKDTQFLLKKGYVTRFKIHY